MRQLSFYCRSADVAELLDVPAVTVKLLRFLGLPCLQIGKKKPYFVYLRSDVFAWAAEHNFKIKE